MPLVGCFHGTVSLSSRDMGEFIRNTVASFRRTQKYYRTVSLTRVFVLQASGRSAPVIRGPQVPPSGHLSNLIEHLQACRLTSPASWV